MVYSALNRLMRPRTFLYLMSLCTGTELITTTMLINKVTGVYGILALFTGYHLSPLQISMYIYSIIALVITAMLSSHIRKQTPLQCLMLGWFYLIDCVVNAAFTAAFSVSWFLVLAKHTAPLANADAHPLGPGGSMIDDTAGFTSPEHNVTGVEVVGTNPTGLISHVDAVSTTNGGVLENTILQSGSIASLIVVSFLFSLRLYFMLVVMAYGRGVLRQSIVASSAVQGIVPVSGKSARDADWNASAPQLINPYSEMQGWQGKLGRAMTAFPKSYWLGADNEGDSEWMRDMGRRLVRKDNTGVVERERRRRAGTGPPVLKPLEMDYLKQ